MTSYKTEVVADNGGSWAGNGLRFATPEEAEGYVKDLAWRWTAVHISRVLPCEDEVTHIWYENQAREVGGMPTPFRVTLSGLFVGNVWSNSEEEACQWGARQDGDPARWQEYTATVTVPFPMSMTTTKE